MLKRVSIQNFKSLKDVTLDLQKVNLLIGPNNSGKTNFLKALESMELDSPTILKEKIRTVHNRDYNSDVSIKLVVDNTGFTFSDEKIIEEIFEINTSNINEVKIHYFVISGGDRRLNAFESYDSNKTSKLGVFKIYKPDPNLISKNSDLKDVVELNSNCSNLVPYILNLSQNHRKAFAELEGNLEMCVGDLVGVSTPAVSDSDFTQLRLKMFDKNGIDYWADEVSEGVLYFLALLCIINQPNPPKLLLLEEPEKGIHPRRIREVMDFIFRLAEEKDVQIILTTHNEHVLDDFSTRPESVFVFDKDDEGATYVRNLQRDIIEPTNARNKELGLDEIDLTTNLSENWLYGLLGGVPSIP